MKSGTRKVLDNAILVIQEERHVQTLCVCEDSDAHGNCCSPTQNSLVLCSETKLQKVVPVLQFRGSPNHKLSGLVRRRPPRLAVPTLKNAAKAFYLPAL